MLTKALIPHFLHGPLQKIKFLSDINVAEADYIRINLLDVFLDHIAPMRPLQKRFWNSTVKMLQGPLIRKNVPMHNFENYGRHFWFSRCCRSGLLNNLWLKAFGRKSVIRIHILHLALVMHILIVHVLSLHLRVNLDGFEHILKLVYFWPHIYFRIIDLTDLGNWLLSVLHVEFVYLTKLILRSWRLHHRFHLFLVGLCPNIKGFNSDVICFRVSLIIYLRFDVCKASLMILLHLYLHFLLRLSLRISPLLLLILVRGLRLILNIHLGILF